jgi:hypothetical protein
MTATSPYLNAVPLTLPQHVERLRERLAMVEAAWERARARGHYATVRLLSDRMDRIEDQIEACEAEIAGRRLPYSPIGARMRREMTVLFDDGPRDEEAAE